MVEPGITPASGMFFRLFHEEPVDMKADPLFAGTPDPRRDPYESNQAIPTLIATRYRARFHERFPDLRIVTSAWFSFLAYPLSGGFRSWSLLPQGLARGLLAAERLVERPLGRLAGFRLMLVIGKR
jgi:hypothetical protein